MSLSDELNNIKTEIEQDFEKAKALFTGTENNGKIIPLPDADATSASVPLDIPEEMQATSASISPDISAQADASNLSLDHKLDLTIAAVPPVQTEFQLLLENHIQNINTPNYQSEVVALMDLQEATKTMAPSSQAILAKAIKFNFADKG